MNTEDRIMKAFKEMAGQQGFYAVKMEDLAANAGITKATVYSYFSSKEDLVNRSVSTFLSEAAYKVEDYLSTSEIVANLAVLVNSIVTEGAFLFNFRSMKDLQIYYINAWHQVEDFILSVVSSTLEVIMKRTKKKWVLEMNPLFLKESMVALTDHFTKPESAAKAGMSLEELSVQLAKLLVYPYLDE